MPRTVPLKSLLHVDVDEVCLSLESPRSVYDEPRLIVHTHFAETVFDCFPKNDDPEENDG